MCILTTKVVLRGKAPKTTFELEDAWMGHLCSQLLLGQDGCAEEMSSTTQSHSVVLLKDGGHEHGSLCFGSSHHAFLPVGMVCAVAALGLCSSHPLGRPCWR